MMEIIRKEYRNITPISSEQQDDIQGTYFNYEKYIYLYFHNENKASKASVSVKTHKGFGEFGNIKKELLITRRKNIAQWFKEKNNPVIGQYEIKEDIVSIDWKPFGVEKTIISFRGQILSNGDVIKGIFYKNNEQLYPERAFYNIEKPINSKFDSNNLSS